MKKKLKSQNENNLRSSQNDTDFPIPARDFYHPKKMNFLFDQVKTTSTRNGKNTSNLARVYRCLKI